MSGEVYTVNEFNPVIFECNATGIPAPTINWFRDSSLLNSVYDSRITLSDHSDPIAYPTPDGNILLVTRTLTLNDAMDDDSDTYTCRATNGIAVSPSVAQNFDLFVRGNFIHV